MFRPSLLSLIGLQLAGLLAPQSLPMAVQAARNGLCPIPGPVLPAPKAPSSRPAAAVVAAGAKELLDGVTAALNYTAVSIAVKSIHEDGYMLEYHRTPPVLDPRGVQQVDGKSVYRIASVTKVFAVLAVLLLDGVSLDDPITKYFPEFEKLNEQPEVKDELTLVDWDEITLGALASHLAGIKADFSSDLSTYKSFDPDVYGLPPRGNSSLPWCSGFLGVRECTVDDFLQLFGDNWPALAPFTTPVYSNNGAAILGLVVSKVSGKSFEAFVQEKILDPLNMKHTFATKPDDKLGVISVEDTMWAADMGFTGPSGAYYASTDDLIALADGILSNKLLSPAKTRKWLKPWATTASSGTMVGAPWEIYLARNVTSDQRTVEVYTKNGGLLTYSSYVVLVPDYDLVFTILATGPTAELPYLGTQVILSTLVQALMPALEASSRDEAAPRYAGVYRDEATNSTVSIALAADDLGPGLNLTGWVVRGKDVMAAFVEPLDLTPPPADVPPPPPQLLTATARLYPTNLKNEKRESWKGVIGVGSAEQLAQLDALLAWEQGSCGTWGSIDRPAYQMRAVDQFIFGLGEDGAAVSVELPSFKVTLKKEGAAVPPKFRR
ncbi:beta-lactamase [Pyricularia oryzae 70-15]|uniref:Beta-lactamase n=2 Tax=Pyricularia oryzae TaxID=318829 RepID=G4NAN2_PYRO7|nr:beta-lactamase [Pyricularia oryzae 70-15]EHA49675.1 beta-lactamase [Pyricularia oryzae 70-15]ELQ34910.1 beta-lactamase family protein [Pyricularia oryzae Y34]KAI7910105.1 beta-lactamase [Pyricularia oryzae]KAI7910856.1 beta-lactamase [Pyricularia oryzae]